MSESLVLCQGCNRHVRAGESACPFCNVVREPTRAALLAGAALAGVLAHGASADAQLVPPRFNIPHMPAQGYGAPPSPRYEPGLLPREEPPAPSVDASRVRVSVAVESPRRGPVASASQRVVAERGDLLIACRGLDPTPFVGRETGRVQFDVLPDGRITSPQVTGGAPARFAACVAARVRTLRLRSAIRLDAPVRVALTFTLTPVVTRPAVRPQPQPQPGVGVTPGSDRCGASPAGCRSTGCPGGMVCDTRVRCVPSSCGCDPSTGRWVCTADCGGGVCVPAGR